MIKKKLRNAKGTISFNGLYPTKKKKLGRPRKEDSDVENWSGQKTTQEEIDFCMERCPNANKPCNGYCNALHEYKNYLKKGGNKKC